MALKPVEEMLKEKMPWPLALALLAYLIAVVLLIPYIGPYIFTP